MFRFPDKPKGNMSRCGLMALEAAAPGLHFAQAKIDGWRVTIVISDEITYTSRHNKPLPVTPSMREWFEPRARAVFTPGTILDGEWCARRPSARVEKIWLFDILQDGDTDLYGEGALARFNLLLHRASHTFGDNIAPHAMTGYVEFFDSMKPGGERHLPEAEGIVLKTRASTFIGSVRESAINPAWTRCRWRGGEDGQVAIR